MFNPSTEHENNTEQVQACSCPLRFTLKFTLTDDCAEKESNDQKGAYGEGRTAQNHSSGKEIRWHYNF